MPASSRPASPGGPPSRVWGIRPRLIVGLVLAVSFLALMSVNLTGLLAHEWWGLALMLLVIVHVLSQWDWTISSTRSFLSRLTFRVRINYLLNWALFATGVLVFVPNLLDPAPDGPAADVDAPVGQQPAMRSAEARSWRE